MGDTDISERIKLDKLLEQAQTIAELKWEKERLERTAKVLTGMYDLERQLLREAFKLIPDKDPLHREIRDHLLLNRDYQRQG